MPTRALTLLPAPRWHTSSNTRSLTRHAGSTIFDDSAGGPSVVDLVRFVGSIDLVSRRRRVEGETPASEDDRIIEAKELSRLEGIDCLTVPTSGEVVRVIDGARQIGRIHHDVLAAVPRKPEWDTEIRDWWVKSWQPSYAELELADLVSASELAEVAHDVGAQLGSTNLRQVSPARQAQFRLAEWSAIARLEPRIRRTARRLVDDLLEAWRQFRARPPVGW